MELAVGVVFDANADTLGSSLCSLLSLTFPFHPLYLAVFMIEERTEESPRRHRRAETEESTPDDRATITRRDIGLRAPPCDFTTLPSKGFLYYINSILFY